MDQRGQKSQPPQVGVEEAVTVVRNSVRPAPVDAGLPSLIGKRVGRYRLVSPIAAGGMAQVWAAKPETSGLARTVAIKLVRPEFAADEEYSRMFVDEAMVASSIHHPNVCEIIELGRDDGMLFMVLEWVPGASFSGLLQVEGQISPVPDEVAARIVADACAGLHAAHEAVGPDGHPLGIVHRDVSPPNILVSLHGHVKVSDFGIAKARHQLHARTRTGVIKGKFAYIPPEQILGRTIDRRADIYALGCVLYVATLGLRPFGSGANALKRVVEGKFTLPSELRSDYPADLEAVIVRALAADPARRFRTAEEMQIALERWLNVSGRPTSSGDIEPLVRERMGATRIKAVEALLRTSQALPRELTGQLLRNPDKADTPTANTGLVVAPAVIANRKSSFPAPPGTDDPTLLLERSERPSSSQLEIAPEVLRSEDARLRSTAAPPRRRAAQAEMTPSTPIVVRSGARTLLRGAVWLSLFVVLTMLVESALRYLAQR